MIPVKQMRAIVAADNCSRAKYRPLKRGFGTGEGLRLVGATTCWCGGDYGHHWPHKEQGAPHPRTPLDALARGCEHCS